MDPRHYTRTERAEADGAHDAGGFGDRPQWRVLVADDEPGIAALLAYMLACSGLEVLCASSGAEAISLARQETPDLVLLDVMMPDLDGREVCQALKQDETLRGIPMILISEVDERHIDWRSAGADAFHARAFDSSALPAFVQRFLGNRA